MEQQLPTALHPLQCNDPYAKKGERPRLSPVVYTKCDCHLWFNFALGLIVGYFDCLFLKSLLNCMQSVLLFVLLHVFCTTLRMILFLVYNSHSGHQVDFKYNPASVHFTEESNCSMVIDMTLLHTNSTIKKTRNLWFEILFTMCMITNQCVIY